MSIAILHYIPQTAENGTVLIINSSSLKMLVVTLTVINF